MLELRSQQWLAHELESLGLELAESDHPEEPGQDATEVTKPAAAATKTLKLEGWSLQKHSIQRNLISGCHRSSKACGLECAESQHPGETGQDAAGVKKPHAAATKARKLEGWSLQHHSIQRNLAKMLLELRSQLWLSQKFGSVRA